MKIIVIETVAPSGPLAVPTSRDVEAPGLPHIIKLLTLYHQRDEFLTTSLGFWDLLDFSRALARLQDTHSKSSSAMGRFKLFRGFRRQKPTSCPPPLNPSSASESSEALTAAAGVSTTLARDDTDILAHSAMKSYEAEISPHTPLNDQSTSQGELAVGMGVGLDFIPADEPPTQSSGPPLSSATDTGEPTHPRLELRDLPERPERDDTPTTPAILPSPNVASNTDTSADLVTHSAHSQTCAACKLGHLIPWFCRACNLPFCDECWSQQLQHKILNKPGNIAHEKTNLEIAEKVNNVLTPPANQMVREKLHHDDELTAWFGEWLQPEVCCILVNAKPGCDRD